MNLEGVKGHKEELEGRRGNGNDVNAVLMYEIIKNLNRS